MREQDNLQNEKFKKILIALVVLALFGTSYYYYGYKADKIAKKSEQKTLAQKEKKSGEQNAAEKKSETKKINEPKKVITEKKDNSYYFNKKIKPTDRSDLIAAAFKSAGKSDPFSYAESRFMPLDFERRQAGGHGLPTPPGINQGDKHSGNLIMIKGFFGNKVIVEVNGFTDSLDINETLGGVKVLGINAETLSCDFLIEGKRVTKTMQPIIKTDENVEIEYVQN